MDEGSLQGRLSRNEAVFRRINEGIQRGHWPGEEDRPVGFLCECARLGCTEVIELSLRQYQRVRANGRRFIVKPGHERLHIEMVVETHPGHLVVEKLGYAAETAMESDPRD